jgi:hypothetical protein
LTSCCSGASPVLVQTVLVSGCMLSVSALLSFVIAVCVVVVVVVSFAVLLLPLSELWKQSSEVRLVCYRSLQFHADAAHAGECQPSPPAECERQPHSFVRRCVAGSSTEQSVRLRQ